MHLSGITYLIEAVARLLQNNLPGHFMVEASLEVAAVFPAMQIIYSFLEWYHWLFFYQCITQCWKDANEQSSSWPLQGLPLLDPLHASVPTDKPIRLPSKLIRWTSAADKILMLWTQLTNSLYTDKRNVVTLMHGIKEYKTNMSHCMWAYSQGSSPTSKTSFSWST